MVTAKPKQLQRVRMEVVTDAAELAEGRERFEQYKRNSDWLKANASEVYSHRGLFVCIAGQELFVGSSATEAKEKGRAAHPEDQGSIVHFVPIKKRVWIYANRW